LVQQKYVDDLKISEKNTDALKESLLLSASYDGNQKVVILKFYNPETKKIHLWRDNTGHKPYCYIKPENISKQTLDGLRKRADVCDIETEWKYDLLKDRKIELHKIIVSNPLAIGGASSGNSIRDFIKTWESDIKYYENYLYDAGYTVGTFYNINNSEVTPVREKIPIVIQSSLKNTIEKADKDLQKSINDWAEILSQPLPEINRLALDIEVLPAEKNRIPDPDEAAQNVIAVSLVGSDDLREVLILRRKDMKLGEKQLNQDYSTRFFDSEKDLLAEVFNRIVQYPLIITFNGDGFDLNYLYHRSLRPEIGFRKEEIPISLGREVANVRPGLHIDLYKTFMNRSIQGYAFNNKYREHTLNGVAEALIKEKKIPFEGDIGNLSYSKLAEYSYQDSRITYLLTSFNDNLLIKLLLVLSRVAKIPIDDVSRISVSNWIRSMMYFEHRKRNALIPKREDLEEISQNVISEPLIKGKKYKGGIVVEPRSGVYFDVAVLDFASLYPSIIKVFNLSYETVKCTHKDCQSKKIPETIYWVCTKKRGIVSDVIGSLRDIRVNYYKPLCKKVGLTIAEKELAIVVSQALKVILNASYGVMGAEIYPLYYLPIADATASLGRYSILKTIEKCKNSGINVVYGDTDSLFLKNPKEEQVNKITKWAEADLGIELDLDKVYRYVAFSKRNTGKKSNTPPFIRKSFYELVNILSKVMSEGDFEHARNDIKIYLREKYLSLKNKEIPIEELAFRITMSKSIKAYTKTMPQHVKAAEILMKKGKEIRAGDIISFVKTTGTSGVKPVALASLNEVDTRKYEEYMRSTFDQILDALGYDFEEIIGATKLEDFFWTN
jgi:DNA polymerase I